MDSVGISCFKPTIWLPVLLVCVLGITASSFPLQLRCHSRGRRVQWYLNTTELKNNNKDLRIRNRGKSSVLKSRRELFGTIKCIDQATGKILLESKDRQKPAFVNPRKQENIISSVGDNLRFDCEARGTPPLEYKWYKNSIRMNVPYASSSIQLPTNSKSDSGTYHCSVVNRYGFVLKFVFLKIQEVPQLPPIIDKTTFQNKTFYFGHNFTMDMYCNVMTDDIGTEVIWLRWQNNFDLEQLKRKAGDMSYQNESVFRLVKKDNYIVYRGMIIFVLTNDVAGCFTCLALNTVGYDYSTICVRLIDKPAILRIRPAIDRNVHRNQTEIVGDDVSMDCNLLSGKNGIQFYWLKWKKGVDLEQLKREGMEIKYSTSSYTQMLFGKWTSQGSRLTISGDLTKRYAMQFTGYYTCLAVNPWGFDYSTRYLHLINSTVIS